MRVVSLEGEGHAGGLGQTCVKRARTRGFVQAAGVLEATTLERLAAQGAVAEPCPCRARGR